MRSRAGLVVLGAALALHCGGESSVIESKQWGDGGNGAAAGVAGRGGDAGASSCARCGGAGVGGTSGGGHGDTGGEASGGRAGGSSAGQSGKSGSSGTSAGRSAGVAGGAGSEGNAAGGRAGEPSGLAGEPNAGAAGEPEPPQRGVTIAKIAVYQAVEIPLMVGGVETPPNQNSPLISGRDALLRVWLAPSSDWDKAPVSATLTVASEQGTRTVKLTLAAPSTSVDGDLASTFDFTLQGGELDQTTSVFVELHAASTTAELLDRWPASGTRSLEPQTSNGAFLVTLVPLIANGFLPDTSETIRLRFESYLARLYPASTVDVALRAAVTLDVDIEPDGTGWDDALAQLYATRDADTHDDNDYYYGVLTPGTSMDDYCAGSCVVGLSNVASRTQAQYRGAIGTGFFSGAKDTFSQETMGHELGHALGREHAPCDTDDADRAFPYPGGSIGVFGYDGTRLLDPAKYTDVMGYCVPVWISDYTYDHIFDRIFYVNGLRQRVLSTPSADQKPGAGGEQQRLLRVGRDGRLRWGHESALRAPSDGQQTSVELLDANGVVLGRITASFAPFDHMPGGFLSLPSAALGEPGVARIRVGGQTLDVP